MILLIPLALLVITVAILRWLFLRLQRQARLAVASASAGIGGYSLVGWLAPHSDPHAWHYASGLVIAMAVFAAARTFFLHRI
jgi:hypothetical protein